MTEESPEIETPKNEAAVEPAKPVAAPDMAAEPARQPVPKAEAVVDMPLKMSASAALTPNPARRSKWSISGLT